MPLRQSAANLALVREYVYIWEFRTTPRTRAAFIEVYRAEGAWDLLFHQDPGFLGTILLQSQSDPDLFVTIDRWKSDAAFHFFLERHRDEYDALDRRCEPLTETEREIGRYEAAE